MSRRDKIVFVGCCVGGVLILVIAVGLVMEFFNPYEGHHHHHHEELVGPETAPCETYVMDGKTYMRAPFTEEEYDVTQSCVDINEIVQVTNLNPGNFPDLNDLQFVPAEGEIALPGEDTVLGVKIGGEEKAYPIRMLNYHVVLNDVCGGREIAVVWDPMTLTPKVFGRRIEEGDASEPLAFGKLALLYKGGFVLYDKSTRSLWWPPEGKCLAGKLSGTFLVQYPFLLARWKSWKERHPGTLVLSQETLFKQKYRRNWYQTVYLMPELPMPVEGWDAAKSRFKWSDAAIVLEAEGKAKAYPISVLSKIEGDVEDTFAGRKVIIHELQSHPPYPTDEEGREILYSFGAWFLWFVRYPNIEVYSPQGEAE